MCVHVLPCLLHIVEKCHESSLLAQSLMAWAEESAAQVLNNLRVCTELLPGNTSHLKRS